MALDDSPLEAETVSEDASESMDVPLDVAEETEAKLEYDEDSLNLVEDFQKSQEGLDFLEEAANEVRENFDQDWESTEEYRKRVENDWRIWAGELPKRTAAFQDAANAHVPILLENMSRIQLRAEGELFGDWSHVFGVMPLGKEDQPDVDLLDLHGNWQIRNQIPDFKRQIASRGLLLFLGPGDVTVHSFYDEARKMNRHEVLSCDEFVIPYVYTTTMPDYSDVPRRTKILPRYKHELEQMRGIWSDVDKVLDGEGPSFEDEPNQPMAETVAKVQGQEIPTDAKAPYKVLWYEGWMTLPKQDRQRFVQVIMDYHTKTIFRMTIHEEPSWQDKAEYEMRLSELLAYRQAFAGYEQAMQQHQGMQAQLGQQLGAQQIGPEQALAGLQGLDAQEPQAPMPPSWMEDPTNPDETPPQPDKKPIHLFTHGVCLENVRGSLGLGYGRIMADYNRAANVSLTQWNDANTLANCKGFITTDNVEMNETFKVQPGGLYKVSGVSGAELKDNLIPFSFDSANAALLENVKLMQSFGEGAMQAPAVLSGAEGKSGETYRGIAARIEQATKQLSVLTRKYANEVLLPVLRNNAYLNSIHLADEELIQIERNILPENVQNPIKITRKLYERNYMVEIKSDLQFASRAQKIQEADDVLNLVKGIPQLQMDIPLMYQVAKKCLMARGFRDLVAFLGPEVPPPPTPMGMMPPPPPGPPGSTGKPGAPPGPPGMPPPPPMPNAPGGPPQGMAS